ncbi:MAG: YCF48-related protein [Bacteroidota bacterium]
MNQFGSLRIRMACLAMLSFLFCTPSLFAQGYDTTMWRFRDPKQFGFTVLDLDFYDDNNVIAVGSDGGIAKSRDGGANWTYGPFTFNTPAGIRAKPTLNDVHYVTDQIIYTVGSNGCMAKSIDAGQSWSFVQTPLYNRGRSINAVWFINKDTGYIGGQHNTPDSLPKLYFTRNGGATWDSLNAPVGGVSRNGYVNNPNYPSFLTTVTAKDKEILRIEFANDSIGYITGSGLSTYEPRVFSVSSTVTCLSTATTPTVGSGAHHSSLVWKFEKGSLTDYSTTKERLGYTGINTLAVTCTTRYGSPQNTTQQYKAIHIINDSTILLMSSNNNIVLKIFTGKNDSTLNVNAPGVFERGRYQTLNFPFPPNGATPIPSPQVLLASNPYQIRKASNGKLFAPANFGYVWTSVDTGRNWIRENSLPQGQNYSGFATWALDISPSGKFLYAGQAGVVADSVPGGALQSTYNFANPAGSYFKMEFADCNNGITSGGSSISVTEDGGKTWAPKNRPDFAASFWNINGLSYRNTNKAYFAVSNGTLYMSPDKGTTLDPIFADPTVQMWDVANSGDSIWAIGHSTLSTPAPSRQSKVFRSFDGGLTWSTFTGLPMGLLAPTMNELEFPTSLIGYAAGTRDTIYKTTDGGVTWSKLPLPTPGVIPQISYKDMFALDANTVFLVGNGFPRKVVFRTTDGGATWTDISGNINSLGTGNFNAIIMHDINNGYVATPSGYLAKTTDGGVTWTLDVAPTAALWECLSFVPRTVPSSISFTNRRMLVAGGGLVSGPSILEYGKSENINPTTTPTVVSASCTSPAGGSITLNTSGGLAPYTYSLNGGAYQSSPSFTGLAAGSYTLAVKDAFCGVETKTIQVGFNDNLTLTASNDTLVCVGTTAQLVASSNSASTVYIWSPGSGLSNPNIANPIATVNSNTTYTVTAFLNGCVRTEPVVIRTKTVTVNAGADQLICAGLPAQLQASSDSTGVSYSWSPALGLSNTAIANPTATLNTTQSYTVTASLNSCTKTSTVTIRRKDVNINAATPQRVCVGVPTQISVSSDSTGASFSWSPATGLSNANIRNPIVTTSTNINYTVTASLNGCTKSTPVAVQTKTVTVNAGADQTVCSGSPASLQATSDSTGVSYSWSPSTGLSSTSVANPTATLTGTQAFTQTYTVTATLNGCTRTDQVDVRVNPLPVISAGPDRTIVSGDEIILTGSGIANPTSILWTPNTAITGANTYTPSVKPTTTTTYTLTVRDNNNCVSTDNAIVNVLPYCINIMNAFTPNGDGINDRWLVVNSGGVCTRQISVGVYNRHGNLVYKNDNYNNDWIGVYNGKPVPDGTYYYVVSYRLITGAYLTFKGDVTILR